MMFRLHKWFAWLALAFCYPALMGAGGWAWAGAKKPNIIFLLTDDQRADSVGFMDNAVIQTPHLDALAAGGVVFEHAYVTTAVCAPSRASIYTGTTHRYHGTSFGAALPKALYQASYPVLLQRAGYETMFVGKKGFRFPESCYDHFWGFRHSGAPYHSERWGGKHLTAFMGDRAIEFLSQRNRDKPFCLSVFFRAPHDEAGVFKDINDPRFNAMYRDAEIAESPTVGKQAFERLPDAYRETIGVKLGHYQRYNQWFSTKQDRQEVIRTRYRLIAGVDEVVGRLRAELKRQGVADNTVIIFSSDNGYYFGERHFALKHFMHEESIRVPLLIHDPRLEAGTKSRRIQKLAANIDIAPTLCYLAGVKPHEQHQGLNLYQAIRGEDWRQDLLCEHLHAGRPPLNDCVRSERWKYIEHFNTRPLQSELYDQKFDPYEQYNLMDIADESELPQSLQGKVSYQEIITQRKKLKKRLAELRKYYARNASGTPKKAKAKRQSINGG